MAMDNVTAPHGVPDPTAVADGEMKKSGLTRRRIVEAGVHCLARFGYNQFSTGQVAAQAGLTRAAMLYHFGSRLDLLRAVIQHVTRRRIEIFEEAMQAIPKSESFRHQTFRAQATDLAWQQLETPEFQAFSELVVAARTDRELGEIVGPALAAFDSARRAATDRIFPPGAIDRQDFQVARDVVRFLSEGVVQQNSIAENREERVAALRHFLHMLTSTTEGDTFLKAVLADWLSNQR